MRKMFHFSVVLLMLLILARADLVMKYTKDAITMCYDFIIPSLFPFFVCSGLLVYSGFGDVLARYLQKVMVPVFNISPIGATPFVLGIISGFPTGAVYTVELCKSQKLSKDEAQRLLAFCNNSGPLFLIGTVGCAIYGKIIYGVILYVIHIISSVIVGIIFSGRKKDRIKSRDTAKKEAPPLGNAVAMSINSASRSIITVCFSIIFFSAISRTILDLLNLSPTINSIVSGLCEFSSGVFRVSELDFNIAYKLTLTSFIVGFSGLCVHLQIMAVTEKSGLSLKPYILGKALHGVIAGILTAVAMIFANKRAFAIPHTIPVLSASFTVWVLTISVSVCVLIASAFLIRKKLS